jgi:excisionase family DNA binding protein
VKKIEIGLYKTSEVADMFGVTRQAVIYWIKNGWLKAIRFGKSYRIKEEDLREFIEKGTVGTVKVKE